MGRPIVCGISVRKDIPSSELNQALYKLVHICSNSSTYHLVMIGIFMSDIKEVERLEGVGSSQLENSEMSRVNLLIYLIIFRKLGLILAVGIL